MIKFKHIRFLIEAYRDRLKQKGVAQNIIDHVETLSSAEKGKAIAKLMANPKLELDDLKGEDFTMPKMHDHLNIQDADPTASNEGYKQPPGDYYRIIKRWVHEDKTLRLPEDRDRVLRVLEYYNEHKRRFKTTYISKYRSFQDLEQEYDELAGIVSKAQEVRDIKMEGSKKIHDDGIWAVYEITTKEAACYYGKGTKWCTAATGSNNYADQYLQDGALWIFINKNTNNKYQANYGFNMFLDAQDSELFGFDIDDETTHEKGEMLGLALSMKEFEHAWWSIHTLYGIYIDSVNDPIRLGKEAEQTFVSNKGHYHAGDTHRRLLLGYVRALQITDNPEIEKIFSYDPEMSYWYAKDVLKARWPEGENTIFSLDINPKLNYGRDYIVNLLGGKRHIPYEEAYTEMIVNGELKQSGGYLNTLEHTMISVIWYVIDVLNERFSEDIEEILFNDQSYMHTLVRYNYFKHFDIDLDGELSKIIYRGMDVNRVLYAVNEVDNAPREYFLEMLRTRDHQEEVILSGDKFDNNQKICNWLGEKEIEVPEYLDFLIRYENPDLIMAYVQKVSKRRDPRVEPLILVPFSGDTIPRYYYATKMGKTRSRWMEMEDYVFSNPPFENQRFDEFFADYVMEYGVELPENVLMSMTSQYAAKYYLDRDEISPYIEVSKRIVSDTGSFGLNKDYARMLGYKKSQEYRSDT